MAGWQLSLKLQLRCDPVMVSVYVMIFELQPVFLKESESLGLESVVPPSGFGKGGGAVGS